MKKYLVTFLIITCLVVMAGCGNNELDYQALVNKTHPISTDYIKKATLVNVKNVYDEEVQLEGKTYQAYSYN